MKPRNRAALNVMNFGSATWNVEKRAQFLDSHLYVIAVDISYDNKVLAYGTNIDGYHLIDLSDYSYIGSLEEHREEQFPSYRVAALRFNREMRNIVIGNGRQLRVLSF